MPQHAFSSCPAKQSACNNCKKIGHWAATCKKKNVHEISKNIDDKAGGEENEKEDLYLGGIQTIQERKKKERKRRCRPQSIKDNKQQMCLDRIRIKITHSEPPWMAYVGINGTEISVKMDIGADAIISEKLYKQHGVGECK